MKVVLSGGGTAGHINPALALADVLRDRGHEVVFAGTPTGVEVRLVAQAGITFVPFEAAGFDRQAPWTLVTSTLKILGSARKAKRWMKEISPDVVVGFGGYVCIPVGLAAESLGVPVVVHEQNSVMGMANKFLAKRAASVALTYEVAGKDVADASKLVVTGQPCARIHRFCDACRGSSYAGRSGRCDDARCFRRKPRRSPYQPGGMQPEKPASRRR